MSDEFPPASLMPVARVVLELSPPRVSEPPPRMTADPATALSWPVRCVVPLRSRTVPLPVRLKLPLSNPGPDVSSRSVPAAMVVGPE